MNLRIEYALPQLPLPNSPLSTLESLTLDLSGLPLLVSLDLHRAFNSRAILNGVTTQKLVIPIPDRQSLLMPVPRNPPSSAP